MKDQASHPEVHRLSNGIPVYFQHVDGLVAATYWWNSTGSADENPKEAGFAHFLEHMLFKDATSKETGKPSEGKMARAIESLGGDINAYTSFDQTVYHVTCAEQHWEKVLDAFGAMAKPQKFLKDDFVREREVILEELRKNEDSPGRMMFQNLFGASFAKHPYGRPVIGFVKTLKAATVKDLEAFYRRRYVSGNMGVILVGPIGEAGSKRRKQLLQLCEKRFGARAIPKRPPLTTRRVVEAAFRAKEDFRVVPFDVKTPTLVVSFRCPDLNHADTPVLDIISSVLGSGELSRLYQSLFYKKQLVTEASAGLYVPRDPGMLYFQMDFEDLTKLDGAVEAFCEELKQFQAEGPTLSELNRVVTNMESERVYSTQTVDGLAGRIGFLAFGINDMEFDRKYIDALKDASVDRIREVATKYLDHRRMGVVLMVPKDQAKYDLSSLRDKFRKAFAPAESEKAPAKKIAKLPATTTPLEEMTLSSGVKVLYHPRMHSQVFSLHASALGGTRLELSVPVESAASDWGLSHLFSMTWTKGTAKKKATEVMEIVEGSAASMDGFSGRNSIGLEMTGLSRDWEKLSQLFGEALFEPALPEDELAHSRRLTLDSIKGMEDHTAQLCSKLFLETLFERHPYGKNSLGTERSVSGIHADKLKAYHGRWLRPDSLVLSVSGTIKRSDLDQMLVNLNERAEAFKQKLSNSAIATVADELDLKAPRWVERNLGREQIHIIVGGLGLRLTDEDRFALRLLQTLLGGQSGRLFIELREKKSLAYTVAPMSFEGMEKGYVGTYIACSPSKKQEAIDGIRTVLEKFAKQGPTAAEVARAKEFYLGRRAMDLQSDASLAAHFGLQKLYGIGPTPEAEIARRIQSVTGKQIQEVCRKYFVEPHMVTAVVG
ncbi:MAG: M16 family metallopeptidase [Bacteriovoracia bacterium]